ncbi:MAG: segregation and condensation protein A [Gammaproteobacteria bacterium]
MKNIEALSKEERVLRVMRAVLIDVIRDTTTKPGLRHPLSERTRDEIRQCLELIAARQVEFAEAAGAPMKERPVFADQPRKSAVVAFNQSRPSPAATDKD